MVIDTIIATTAIPAGINTSIPVFDSDVVVAPQTAAELKLSDPYDPQL